MPTSLHTRAIDQSPMGTTWTSLRLTFGRISSAGFWMEAGRWVLLLVGTVVVWRWGRGLSGSVAVGLWGLWLLILAVALRRGWLKLFGPVLFYDMLCLARRGRYIWMRCAYAGLLFLVFLPMWTSAIIERQNTPQSMALLAEEFFAVFMVVQLIAVAVLTPAYVAGAVADEKVRKTLEFLLATDLGNREIVLSKLGSRFANLTLFVITGLPILSFLQFLGGVDPNLVIAGFAVTGLTMLGLSSLSILLSVQCKRPRDAIALTYLTVIAYVALSTTLYILKRSGFTLAPSWPIWFGASPPTLADLVDRIHGGNLLVIWLEVGEAMLSGTLATVIPELLTWCGLFTAVVCSLCLGWSVLRLRAIALQQAQNKEESPSGVKRTWQHPPVGHFPMLWKEIFVEGGLRLHWFARIVALILIVLSLLPGLIMAWMYWVGPLFFGWGPGGSWDYMAEGRFWFLLVLALVLVWILARLLSPRSAPYIFRSCGLILVLVLGLRICDSWFGLSTLGPRYDAADFARGMNAWLRSTGMCVACLTLLAVAVRASSAISSEREKQTMDSLLTSPLDSTAILGAKWLGSVLSVRQGWLWLGAIWVLGLLSGGLHLLALPLLLAAWFVFAAVVAMIGLGFSMACRSSMMATVWTLIVTVMAGVGHWLIWFCCGALFIFAGPGGRGIETLIKLHGGFTPPAQLFFLAFCYDDLRENFVGREMMEMILFSVLGMFFWVGVAAGLWAGILVPRFRAQTGRQPLHGPEWDRHGRPPWAEDEDLQERPPRPLPKRDRLPELQGAQLIEDIQEAILVDDDLKGARLVEEEKKDQPPGEPKQ